MAILRYLWSIKWSLVGLAAALLGSFLSLGMLGYVLYYLAYPVVGIVYPPMSAWRPDSVWPLIVAAGMLWSASFLPAGALNHNLSARGIPASRRAFSYLAVLWAGAVAAWLFLLATGAPASGSP